MNEISNRRQTVKQDAEATLEQRDEKKSQLQCPDSSSKKYSAEYEIAVLFEKHWQEVEQYAKAYNIEGGHVHATSGQEESGHFHDGCLDWGIFYNPFPNAKNKVT